MGPDLSPPHTDRGLGDDDFPRNIDLSDPHWQKKNYNGNSLF